ncbi:MAG: glutamine synthetase, glutamine synthetase [Candidatus Peregrinibacteria bacterium GW2011_GWF2_43_17]|nr:MAG: glutamine synthetase, glutamine synthetase [Candidatus Peregrinibacteria bacterium GW2011_GWF2_43_17]
MITYAYKRKSGMMKHDILDMVKQAGVKYVNMQFVDLFGMPKAITIPVHKLEGAIDNNVWFDGSSIEGFARIQESDMYLKPDLDTFSVLPWTKDRSDVIARIICDVYTPKGDPFAGDPRFILRKQLAKAKEMGFSFNTGPELEFFLFRKNDDELKTLPNDKAGYFDQTNDLAIEVRNDMSFALDEMGIEVEALHHEVAPGQHEIDFKYGDALMIADSAITFKMVLKAIAAKYGLHATFMAKPIAGINGTGMHVHQSLADINTGANLFYDPGAQNQYGLSNLALSFIAGQLDHIKGMNAITNPTVNSYKRLVVGYEAPVYIAWARTNRSALIRVPCITSSSAASATRVELRCPDPMCNPYLAFAVMLSAGLDGVKRGLRPPAPVEEDIFELTDEKAAGLGIECLNENLMMSLKKLEKDELVRSALGETLYDAFYRAKKDEWDRYRLAVTNWEIGEYLERY